VCAHGGGQFQQQKKPLLDLQNVEIWVDYTLHCSVDWRALKALLGAGKLEKIKARHVACKAEGCGA
jgi:hypothetical protein